MQMSRLITIFLLMLACVTVAAQQQFRFINFSAKDGLPEKYIYHTVQDDKGYMWFATANGLYRYDGHSFRRFRSTVDKPGSSIANTLQAIETDDAGNLWLGSINALQCYNPLINRFSIPRMNSNIAVKMNNAIIQSISRGSNGTMWISTNKNYFFKFSTADSSFTHFNQYPATATKAIIKVIDAGDEVYAVHTEGLYCFSKNGQYKNAYPVLSKDVLGCLFQKEMNRILLTTNANGVLSFELSKKAFAPFEFNNKELSQNILFCITQTKTGAYFLGGYPLHYIHPVTNTYSFVKHGGDAFSLGNTKIVSIVADRENNIWFCSHSGLSMLPVQNTQIQTVQLRDNISNILAEPEGVYKVPGTTQLIISTTNTNGALLYNYETGIQTTINNPAGKIPDEKRLIGLVMAPDSTIFLSDNIHFYKYLPLQQKLVPYKLNDTEGKPIFKPGHNVFDREGTIYINCKRNGFYTWQYPDGPLKHYNKNDIDPEQKENADNIISPAFVDSKNNCWLTSSNGVYRYDKKKNKYEHIGNNQFNDLPLMGVTIDVAEDRLGHIWITTQGAGLFEWYMENGKEQLKNYTQSSGVGLPGDFCWTIQQSPVDSVLWISNVAGLLRFDPIQKKVLSVYSKQNGFTDDDGGYTFTIMQEGLFAQLYFGHLHLFNLRSFSYNKINPAVQLQSVKVMDKEMLYEAGLFTKPLRLAHHQIFLQFEFAALVLNNANRNTYSWQLEGADKNWIYGGNENKVAYSGLQPGTYTFRVKAANSDGVWGEETALTVIIAPPFYAAWWFVLLCICMIAALLYAWNRYRITQARREEQLKAGFQQQIAETEMKALRAQMNPHFIFNSLNSIQKYILKNEHFEASQYLTKFSRLIRLILDHSNQNSISIAGEMDLLKLYAEMESLRFNSRFEYSIVKDENISAETTEIPTMLVQPYVENAIWHGLLHKNEKGKLMVQFRMKDANNLQVVVEDNGIGREKAAELKSKQVLKKKSYGMQITEDRIAIINRLQHINATCSVEDLKNERGVPTGTRVILDIPLKQIDSILNT
jgi:ligand-binding sensor domain-containing protein/two-component sensor histidine kinase